MFVFIFNFFIKSFLFILFILSFFSSLMLSLLLLILFLSQFTLSSLLFIYSYFYFCYYNHQGYFFSYQEYGYYHCCRRPYCLDLRHLCCCYCDIVLIAVFVVVSGNAVAFVIGIVFAAVVGVAIWIVGSVFLFLVFSLCHSYCKTSLCIRLICSL